MLDDFTYESYKDDSNITLYSVLDAIWSDVIDGALNNNLKRKHLAAIHNIIFNDKINNYNELKDEIKQISLLLGDNSIFDNYKTAIVLNNI